MELEKLSALRVKRASKPGLYGDGHGLYLRVGDGNAKSWVLRYMLSGVAHSMGIGAVADFSLAEARERAAKYRKLAKQGIDPIEARRADRTGSSARAITFAACAEAYIANHKGAWKGARHAKQWTSSLEAYACPALGGLPVSRIDTTAVMSVLGPIWTQKPETAARLRGRIESVLDFATSAGYRSGENPARWRGHLANLLPRKSKVAQVKHYQALPYAAMPAFMTLLRQRTGVADYALQFAILTAVRSGEALAATWDEFDLEAKLWTIPAERMKAKRDHIVPLSDAVLVVLAKMRVIRQPGAGVVFAGRRRGRPLGHGQLLRTIAALGYRGVTTHGMRSAFRDWAGDCTAFPRELAEAALAHVVGDKSETAYRRSTAIEKRRCLMQALGRLLRQCEQVTAFGRLPDAVCRRSRCVRYLLCFLEYHMDSDHGGNTAGSGYLITAPVPFFATSIAGIGVSTAWALIAAGEIETIAVGRRRLVVIESWRNYVARKLAAPPEDARRNNRVRPSARLRSKPLPAGEAAPVTRPESTWVAQPACAVGHVGARGDGGTGSICPSYGFEG